jgi:cell wall-associated NlpC family hydrolase
MRLQNDLHLPTRQRHDGHHEISGNEPALKESTLRRSSSQSLRIARAGAIFMPAATALIMVAAHAEPKPVGTWGWTSGSATYMRIRPGQQTPVVAKVPRHTQVMVWGTYDGWYRVETVDHKFGWIYHDYATVPKADKLQELSHFKAKAASDRTGKQVLYGNPALLKKYYARYKASGARTGLQKQGVQVVAAPSAPKVVWRPAPVVKTSVVKTAVKASKPVVRTIASAKRSPRTIDRATVTIPNVVTVATMPQTNLAPVVTPNTPAQNTPNPTVVIAASEKPVTDVRPTRAAATPKPASDPVTVLAPMSPSQLPRITAEDIMRARQQHLQSAPAFRHKTRLFTAPKAPSAEESAATVQPSSFDPAALITSATPLKNVQTTSASPIYGTAVTTTTTTFVSGSFSRGGSPRDMARWAMANNRFGDGIAKQALSYRGMPYIRGASSPNRGFDCSGLVYYLLRQRGYNPPRTAAGLTGMGASVSRGALKPGDIVFFANTYKRGVSHVGVYIGKGKFVHAANAGAGVRTDSLNSSYYAGKYWGARRLK